LSRSLKLQALFNYVAIKSKHFVVFCYQLLTQIVYLLKSWDKSQ